MPERWRESIATAVRRTALAPMVTVEQRAENVRATIITRDSVQNLRAQTVGRQLETASLSSENDQLRRLLGIGAKLGHGFVAAEVLHTDAFDRDFTLTLSVGSNAGVEPFTPVVTADGIVGMVHQVDATMSYAISWAHPDFAVSAMSEDGAAFGIVQPHLGTGAERWLLEMRNVAFRSPLKPGTVVVSSGLGKTYPRGIPIGTVLSEIPTPDKWARTYLIKPAVLPNTPGPVLLMIPSRSAKDVNGVWTTLSSADSAARSVVAAGDSMARKAALDELAARKAALDSANAAAGVDSTGAPVVAKPDTAIKRPAPRDTTRKPPRTDSVKPKPPTGPPPPVDDAGVRTWP